ncbi:SDR family NAD(P)-dependent oxidoreductase [Actinokineospora sp. G85]|uniref:SDR family NAD(P)-dependent oxidoreductase n=1 Tax=Actinokineospora sp. G85 TaxID=3406626 RepID=UPI003C732179
MGVELVESSPVFAARMGECAEALSPFVDWDLLSVLDDESALARVDVVQPVSWAVMVSLAALWRASGVEPTAVIGHSQGEIAAAVVAGALSLEDGARVVALRSELIGERLSGLGGMVSVPLPLAEVEARVAAFDGRIGVAAVNGPSSVVVSGDADALDELLAAYAAGEVRAKRIPVDYASHSTHVEAIEAGVLDALAPITPRRADIPLVSTVTGEPLDTTTMDAAYWYRSLRQTVLFQQAVATRTGVFIEVSPHPVLSGAIEGVTVATLRRDQGGLRRFTLALGEAFACGAAVDWAAVTGPGTWVDLPTYAFQRERFWWDPPAEVQRSGRDDEFWDLVRSGALGLDADAPLSAVLPALDAWRADSAATAELDDWRYEVVWRPQPELPAGSLTGRWLVATAPGNPLTDAATAMLTRHGGEPVVVEVTEVTAQDRAALAAELPEGPFAGVVSLLSVGAADSPDRLVPTLTLVQALDDAGLPAPVWVLSRGAVSTGADDPMLDPDQAMVWGFGRIVALETPERWGGLVDLPAAHDTTSWDRAAAVIAHGDEDQVAIRGGGALVRRLARTTAKPTTDWTPTGTVVVTGGTGALGAKVARWAARLGAPSLLLLSRRGPAAAGADELVADIEAAGARVQLLACDITDRDALAAALAGVPEEHPVRSVFHTAAVLDDGVVSSLTPVQVERVVRAKVSSAWALHELTRDLPLEAFAVFSSMAGVWGASGQGNYAPGNAFLDAFAQHRRHLGLPATAVAWGPWAEGGMAAYGIGEIARRHGVPEMAPDKALRSLHEVIRRGDPATVVADIDWPRFLVAYTASRPSPFLGDLAEVRALAPAVEEGPATEGLPARLATLPAAEQVDAVVGVVRAQVAAVLGYASGDDVEERKAFKDLGFDSVTAVQLRNALARATGLTLPATLVFDYPTASALAEHLLPQLAGGHAPATATDVYAELDRVAAALGGLDVDERDRVGITARLTELVRAWQGGDGQETQGEREIESASDDEIFDLLGEEFGIS